MTKSELQQVARDAAHAYLKDGAVLNNSIISSAQTMSLNNHQIGRICEFANHMVRKVLYKTKEVKQNSVTFALADPVAVVLSLAKPGGNDSVHDDYLAGPSRRMTAIVDSGEEAGVSSKEASRHIMQKSAQINDLNTRVYIRAMEYDDAREKFASAVVQHLRNRGSVEHIAKVATAVDKGDILYRVINNLEETTPMDVKDAIERIKDVMGKGVDVVRINEQEPVTRSYNYLVTVADSVRTAAENAKQEELRLSEYTKQAAGSDGAVDVGIGKKLGKLAGFGAISNAFWGYTEIDNWLKNIKKREDLQDASPQGKFMAINQMTSSIDDLPGKAPRWGKPVPITTNEGYQRSLAGLYKRPEDWRS